MDRSTARPGLIVEAAGAQAPGPAKAAPPDDGAAASPPARHAAETARLYAADWAAFANWCRQRGHAAWPASSATVADYLGSLSAILKPGALARRAAAIADRHRRHGQAWPTADPAIRAVLRAARDAADAARHAGPATPPPARASRRRPLGPEQLARMAARCPGDLAGLRDRALLLLAAAGLGAGRLLALDREHVRFTGGGAALAAPGDRPGLGALLLARAAAPASCPVRALEAWLHNSDTRFGPVFRKVDRWGNVEHRRLRADGLRRVWRRRAAAARASPPGSGAAP